MSQREYRRVCDIGTAHYYALLNAGERLAECSCRPHVQGEQGALTIVERALNYRFPSRYREDRP